MTAARAGLCGLVLGLVPACEESTASSSTPAGDALTAAPADDRTGDAGSFEPWFEEVAAERGLVFEHVSGHDDAYLMPEIMGGGGALLDVDDDGWLDAYLVQSGHLVDVAPADQPPNQLFVNRGDGSFRDATAGSGTGDRGYGMGVAVGDVENDGDLDLYVTNWGPNVLLVNDGEGCFVDQTRSAGVGDPGWGTSATFFDMDADGALDLYVANYLGWTPEGELSCRNFMGEVDYCNPANYSSPALDVLYRGLGAGRFEDVTDAAGIRTSATGLGVGCADFDGDGRTDVFVANDGMPDMLWHNEGGGAFRETALVAGCALDHSGQPKAGMGVALEDVDDDGDVDLLVCNLDKQSDSFFINRGGLFSDATARSGLATSSRPFTRFGVVLADLDLDGRLDLFQANGRVGRKSASWSDDPFAEPNLLLAGQPDGRFGPLSTADGTAEPEVATSRGLALGDVDNDGAPDLLVVNRDAAAHLLANRTRPGGPDRHWIGLDVRETAGQPAIGATLTLVAGERRIRRDVRPGASYLASHDPRLLVGLGPAGRVEGIVVRWIDGQEESFGTREVDRWHALRRGQGR